MKIVNKMTPTLPVHIFRRLLQVIAILPLMTIYLPTYAETDVTNLKSNPPEFSQAELDQILAPIALYPDTILSQVLIAATYPIEVVQADRWAQANTSVKGEDAVKRVENKDWDPSVKALVAFPEILKRMSDNVDWTQKLGDAFLTDEGRVMDSIQSLRKQAYASGSLNKVQHLKVQRDEDQIVIEPAEERVVYVPVYDTRVVYGNWWWPEYPPVYWHHSSYNYVSGFYWGPRIFIGPSFFFSSCHWRQRHVVVVEHHNHHHHSRPYFYTGRSIVHYEGARAWRHAPVHRRGVAYYNNQQREHYGSRHESYRDAHVYRDQYRGANNETRRGNSTPTHTQTRFDEMHRGNSRINQTNGIRFATPSPQTTNTPPADRATQLRERMQQSAERNNSREPSQFSRTTNRNNDRTDERGETRNDAQNQNQNHERQNISEDWNRTNRQPIQRTDANDRTTNIETNNNTSGSRLDRIQNEANNNTGGSRLDRIQQDRTHNNERRTESNNNRTTRIDDSMTRRVEATRGAPREERSNNGGGRMSGGGSREDERSRR